MKIRCLLKVFLLLIFSVKLIFSQQGNQYKYLINDTNRLFSDGYYSFSLQTALFSYNVFNENYTNELIDLNILKNSLRLNETGSEKLMSNFSLNYLNNHIEKSIILAKYTFSSAVKAVKRFLSW